MTINDLANHIAMGGRALGRFRQIQPYITGPAEVIAVESGQVLVEHWGRSWIPFDAEYVERWELIPKLNLKLFERINIGGWGEIPGFPKRNWPE